MFFGEKLQNARELNGLSRKELADKIGVSEQAIWQYENQYTTPKFEVINKLKNLFSVKAQFFYTKSFIVNNSKVENIAYRAEDRDYRRKTNMETTFINFTSYFLDQFENKLHLPTNKITLLRDEIISLFNSNNDKNQLLEQIANHARGSLDVQNNKELLYKLELSGVYIFEKEMGIHIDAYSLWTNDEKPMIVLGSEKKSAVRRNFDLAHELGHLLLHYKVDMDSLTKDEHKQLEQEANTFASLFLLPTSQFTKDFSTITKKSNPKSYLELKSKYMVSITALEFRAYKLGLLSFEENRYFYAALNKYGYRKNEPLDDEIAIIKPGKIRALLDLIFKNKLYILNDFINFYHIDRSFLESLFSLESDFLEKYASHNDSIYFTDENIIPLFRQ